LEGGGKGEGRPGRVFDGKAQKGRGGKDRRSFRNNTSTRRKREKGREVHALIDRIVIKKKGKKHRRAQKQHPYLRKKRKGKKREGHPGGSLFGPAHKKGKKARVRPPSTGGEKTQLKTGGKFFYTYCGQKGKDGIRNESSAGRLEKRK